MEAVVKISGKQYRVSEGQRVTVDRLGSPVGEEVTFDEVLLLTDGTSATVGTPTVDGAVVTALVVAAPRGRKILVYKYKPKKRYRRTQGHRAAQSVLQVLAVSAAGGKVKAVAKAPAKAEKPKAEVPKAEAPKAETVAHGKAAAETEAPKAKAEPQKAKAPKAPRTRKPAADKDKE